MPDRTPDRRARRWRGADPRRTYYGLETFFALFWSLGFTLNLVYQVEVVGLSPFQLVVVGTVMEATCFLGEVPTGVVADLYSRRLSVLIGFVLIGAGLALQGAVPQFWAVLLAQVVWGIGYTFTSGATEAWITDEVGEEDVQPLFTRATQIGLAMSFAGTLLAGVVGSLGLGLPLVVAGAGYVATAAVLALVMPERNFRRTPAAERESYGRLGRLLADALGQARRRPVVRSFLVVSLVLGLSSEAVDRLWVPRVVADFDLPDVPVLSSLGGTSDTAAAFTLFALMSAGLSLVVSLVVNRYAERAVSNPHPNVLLAGLVGVEIVGILGLALLGHLWLALAALWTRNAARALAIPIQAAWLNRNVDSRSRATLLSVDSQLDAVGQVLGGPPLGALATRTSIPVALVVSAGLLTPAAAIYARLRPDPDAQPAGVVQEPL